MTLQELMNRLAEAQRLSDTDDVESGHMDADDALLEYINIPEVTEAYHRVRKWYA